MRSWRQKGKGALGRAERVLSLSLSFSRRFLHDGVARERKKAQLFQAFSLRKHYTTHPTSSPHWPPSAYKAPIVKCVGEVGGGCYWQMYHHRLPQACIPPFRVTINLPVQNTATGRRSWRGNWGQRACLIGGLEPYANVCCVLMKGKHTKEVLRG